MLSHVEVDERLRQGRIKIWYAFLPDPQGFRYAEPDLPVDLEDPDAEATAFFHRCRYSNHLHLTTGPVFQSHHAKRVGGRASLPHYPNCFDAREDKQIVFEPWETLTILTNERMELDGATAALVIPRVTNNDSGLLLSAAYIDPFYSGIMRVVVTNVTPHRQSLRVLEPLGQCFFFNLSKPVSESFSKQFAEKTKFFGHTWAHVVQGDGDPFPRRKKPRPDKSWWDGAKRAILSHLTLATILKWFVLGGGGALVLAGFANIQKFLKGYDSLEALADRVSVMERALPYAGSSVIFIGQGEVEGQIPIGRSIPSTPSPHIWVDFERDTANIGSELDLSFRLMPDAASGDTTVLLVARLRNGTATSPIRVPVLWMITR